jgi:hypothetical protein
MEYKKRLTVLLSIIGVLAAAYISTVVFTPELSGSRSSSYVWLDSKLAARTVRIMINTPGTEVELVKKNNQWFVLNNDKEYPARAMRVEDFIGIFTTRSAWTVRSTSASSHERLGLDSSASRVTLYGENTTLLDLLLGNEDVTGSEINVRRYGQNEVRSGNNLISSYAGGEANSWYNLRLIPETEDGKIALDSVQRISVYSGGSAQVFSRKNRQWTVSGIDAAKLDQGAIDGYIKAVLNAEGEDFSGGIASTDPMFDYSRITLELGNGSIRTIRLSEANDSGQRYANVIGSAGDANSDYVYVIASWAAQRLFRNFSDFEKQ